MTQKEITERVRIEYSKKYKEQIKTLEDTIKELKEHISVMEKDNSELASKNADLMQTIEELRKLCNMSEDELKTYLRVEKTKVGLMETMTPFMQNMVNFM